MLLVALSVYSRNTAVNNNTITVYYDIPKLQSNQQIKYKSAVSQSYYFVALTSDQVLNDLIVEVFYGGYGPSFRGGLIFQIQSLVIRQSSIKFIQVNSQGSVNLAYIISSLTSLDTTVTSNGYDVRLNNADLSSIANSVDSSYDLLLKGQVSFDAILANPCESCINASSPANQNCWGCPTGQSILNAAEKKCKCEYSNAIIDDSNNCVSSTIYDMMFEYSSGSEIYAYTLDCSKNMQIDIKISQSGSGLRYYEVMRDDYCVPTNVFLKGNMKFSYMTHVDFQYSGLTYMLSSGCTEIRMQINFNYDNKANIAGMLYVAASGHTSGVTVKNVYIFGSLYQSYYSSTRTNNPIGGIIGYIINCKNITIEHIQVYGATLNTRYMYGLAFIVGQEYQSEITITDIYVGPKEDVIKNYQLNVELANYDTVVLPCKDNVSAQLKPSYQLQALAMQYNNGNPYPSYVNNYNYYMSGVIGYIYSSILVASNIIVYLDVDCYDAQSYGAGFFVGFSQNSNLTVTNAYGTGNLRVYRSGGGVTYLQGGTSAFSFAVNFTGYAEYEIAPLARITDYATADARIGVNMSVSYNAWYSGLLGYVFDGTATVSEAWGTVVFPSGAPSRFGYVCGYCTYSTIDGVYYDSATSVNDATNAHMQNCN